MKIALPDMCIEDRICRSGERKDTAFTDAGHLQGIRDELAKAAGKKLVAIHLKCGDVQTVLGPCASDWTVAWFELEFED